MPAIRQEDSHALIDETAREIGLQSLRQQNFALILERLGAFLSPPARLLDIGCAHGWFLEAAAERGFAAYGIEPDSAMQRIVNEKGLNVWRGFFPSDIPSSEHFDVITFHDVLEHIPNVEAVIEACHERLVPGGILVLNLPNAEGVFYLLASTLHRLGISRPLDRMWQKGFPSPHVSYFTPHHLSKLLSRFGFSEIHRSSLPSIQLAGLWDRLRYNRNSPLTFDAITMAFVLVALPFVRMAPPDISLQFFRRID